MTGYNHPITGSAVFVSVGTAGHPDHGIGITSALVAEGITVLDASFAEDQLRNDMTEIAIYARDYAEAEPVAPAEKNQPPQYGPQKNRKKGKCRQNRSW